MMADLCDSDVLIVGAGPVGLYTALLLTKMGMSVRIIDKMKSAQESKNRSFLWSPRSVQLLTTLGVSESMLKDGHRHWKFEVFNRGSRDSAASPPQHQVWETDMTSEANASISYDSRSLCEALLVALANAGVQVEYQHELTNLDNTPLTALDHQEKIIHATIQSQGTHLPWSSRFLIAADGKHSFVRQHLDMEHSQKQVVPGMFYSLEATVANCNFPGKKMSIVRKGPFALFTVGHGKRRYFMLEHQTQWSGLAVNEPVPISVAQRHIQALLEPYHIDFKKTHTFFGWKAENDTSGKFSHDRRFFFVGGAAQALVPPGILSCNLALEQAHNLGWKLYLHLQKRASPLLMDTFDDESASKWNDGLTASSAFMALIASSPSSPSISNTTSNSNCASTHSHDRKTLMADTPFQANIINLDNPSNYSLALSTASSHTVTTATQMLLPTPSAVSLATAAAPGAVGSLAANPKLKPYTMIQILLAQSSLFPNSRPKKASSPTIPPSSPATPPPPNDLGSVSLSNVKRHLPAITKPLFSFGKLTSSTKKKGLRTSPTPPLPILSTTTLPAVHTPLSSQHQASDRWRVIRPTYFYLLDKIKADQASSHPSDRLPVSFTVLVFCGSLLHDNTLSNLSKIRRYLDSSNSFIHRYETNHQQQHRPLALPFYTLPAASLSAGTASTVADPSCQNSSSLSIGLSSSLATSPNSNPRTSLSSYSVLSHRSSFSIPRTSISTTPSSPPTSPTSLSWRRASLDEQNHRLSQISPLPPSLHHDPVLAVDAPPDDLPPLFSFAYITSSSKPEITRCLLTTAPTMIQAAFPFGLDKVYVDHDQQCHTAFSAMPSKSSPGAPTLIVLRPDGYIAARIRLRQDSDMDRLDSYFDAFLRPHCDMSSAASLVADAYSL
ncbi:FAD/NAD(P)-binding domain-containing protein [Hesseltinella vesiculosa]|uniref:FAD/NAD(P)-binding domain-containing protein n=1 Tax=Hesseltinella vesiculosa TaxID=101127 RepID=A0A1X2GIU6_9FUNG|nr:FAD/NAD(P)-binding domain-containing protein [Hesseltinella vesiculosa]